MSISKPKIMGIVNVTPDSFSDGGDYDTQECAIAHGYQLLEDGADILDIGGESTRPGANPVTIDEEIQRVVPVIEALAKKTRHISVDTRNAKTIQAAIEAGATMVNDVSAMRHDPDSVHILAKTTLPMCLMHMQGDPQNMQDAPEYSDVIEDICSFFEERIVFCEGHGINKNRIILDPGIGFGKTTLHNLQIIKNIRVFQKFGCPVLLGTSRKRFIGEICSVDDPKQRLMGSVTSILYGLGMGVQMLRVHDVKETKQAFDMYQAILEA